MSLIHKLLINVDRALRNKTENLTLLRKKKLTHFFPRLSVLKYYYNDVFISTPIPFNVQTNIEKEQNLQNCHKGSPNRKMWAFLFH